MPRTIHVAVIASIDIEDDSLTDKEAIQQALATNVEDLSEFDRSCYIFDRYKEQKAVRKGRGSY